MLYAFTVCIPRNRENHFIKPQSALAYPLAIVRVFARWGIYMPGYQAVKATLGGLKRMYLAYHGPHSLVTHRVEPMKFKMVHAMYNIPIDGTIAIARMLWIDTNHLVFVFRRLVLFMMYTAFRLGEIVFHSSTEIMYLTRSSVNFRINHVYLDSPTRTQLLSMVVGRDIAIVQPPRSKSDPWGEIHCAFPIYLTYGKELGNVAAALRDIELRLPCEDDTLRAATALFGG